MNKLLISAGIAISAVSLMAAVPAQASTLTFDVKANASLDVGLSPFLAGRTLGDITLPNSLDIDTNDVTGSFTVLDDPAQLTDGDIELTYDVIDSLLGDSYSTTIQSLLGGFGLTPSQALQSADDIFTITNFTGNGVLTSQAPGLIGDPDNPSPFDIIYKRGVNSLLLDGFDTEVAESCLSNTCLITGNISFGVGLVLGEFVTFTSDLLANSNVPLSSATRDAITGLQQTAADIKDFTPILDIATVVASVSATTELVGATPSGTAVGGDTPVDLSTPGGSVDITTGVIAVADSDGTQDVPEPSIILGLLGTAALIKGGRKKTVA